MRVLRISHSAVVSAWRERERQLRHRGVQVLLLSARRWDEGGRMVDLTPAPGEDVQGVPTIGAHPALFVYHPGPLWRALGEEWDLIDIHEEPFALSTAEVLALRWVRAKLTGRPAPPYLLYSAQNIRKRYPFPFRQLEARALRGAAGVSVCNVAAGEIVRSKGARGALRMIPLGVDPPVAGPREAPDRTAHQDGEPSGGPDGGVLQVGYVGRLAPHKGVHVLVRAVAADERLVLRIAGDGPSRTVLESMAEGTGGRISFVGSLAGQQLEDFYRSLDVLTVPSLETPGWVEQFGRVAVEAMACGVPVVASDSGALPDVVGEAGILVPPGDADALREALLRVLTEQGLATRLRRSGLVQAEGCTWATVARLHHDLYTEALRQGTARQDVGDLARPDLQADEVDSGGLLPEVVLVAYGSPDLVRQALTPLAGAMPLTVVDNSSMPQIRALAEEVGARYLDPGRNGGFAFGVNHALAHRQDPTRDVLLLNPDAETTVEDVAALQRALHRDPRLASVGPSQVDGNGVPSRVRWGYPSPAAAWVEAAGLGALRRAREDRSFVIGSVLLLRRDALADVGGFDERFFLYAEETDWAYRANLRGWRHAVVPEVVAAHLGAATSSDPTRRDTHFYAAQEKFLRKHHGAAGWQVARLASILGAGARMLVLPSGERRESARRRVRAYLRGPVREEARLPSAGRAQVVP